jgi:hypothetical protein
LVLAARRAQVNHTLLHHRREASAQTRRERVAEDQIAMLAQEIHWIRWIRF